MKRLVIWTAYLAAIALVIAAVGWLGMNGHHYAALFTGALGVTFALLAHPNGEPEHIP